MDSEPEDVATKTPEFEPSTLIEYGEADKLTQGVRSNPNSIDGTYVS
jgi:hypothetical protein